MLIWEIFQREIHNIFCLNVLNFGLQSCLSTYITSNDLFLLSFINFVSQNRINRRKFNFDVHYYALTHVKKMLFVYGSSWSAFICRIRHFQTRPIVGSSNVLTFKWKPGAYLELFLLKQITSYWMLIDRDNGIKAKILIFGSHETCIRTIKFLIYFDSWFETDLAKLTFT